MGTERAARGNVSMNHLCPKRGGEHLFNRVVLIGKLEGSIMMLAVDTHTGEVWEGDPLKRMMRKDMQIRVPPLPSHDAGRNEWKHWADESLKRVKQLLSQ